MRLDGVLNVMFLSILGCERFERNDSGVFFCIFGLLQNFFVLESRRSRQYERVPKSDRIPCDCAFRLYTVHTIEWTRFLLAEKIKYGMSCNNCFGFDTTCIVRL
jgi:hypothetical protein